MMVYVISHCNVLKIGSNEIFSYFLKIIKDYFMQEMNWKTLFSSLIAEEYLQNVCITDENNFLNVSEIGHFGFQNSLI